MLKSFTPKIYLSNRKRINKQELLQKPGRNEVLRSLQHERGAERAQDFTLPFQALQHSFENLTGNALCAQLQISWQAPSLSHEMMRVKF